MTWYTDDVRKALEIVPVEWADRYRLRCEGHGFVREWRDSKGKWICVTWPEEYESQSIIEKALREWLEERCDGHSVSGKYDLGWHVWDYVEGESRELVGCAPTYIEALAAAVLAHAEDTP